MALKWDMLPIIFSSSATGPSYAMFRNAAVLRARDLGLWGVAYSHCSTEIRRSASIPLVPKLSIHLCIKYVLHQGRTISTKESLDHAQAPDELTLRTTLEGGMVLC